MNKLIEIASNSNNIAVTSHVDPDGDSIGSILALGLALKQKYKNVEIFTADPLPARYDFLVGSKYIKRYEDVKDKAFDLFFALDCGDENRLGKSIDVMKKSKTVVNIDHHISNTQFGDINIVDINSSSTCEMIFSIIKDTGLTIDEEIATCIYTGIVTDSGNFMYDNATDKTHLIAAELIRANIDKQEIMYNLYQKKSIKNLRFLGYCLTNMEIELDGHLAIFQITSALLDKFDIPSADVEGIVNYGRDIDGVDISVTIREETDNKLKLSFRSKHDDVDVRKLAELFNGGGHKKASGATLNASLDEAKALIIENAKQFIRR